MKCGEMEKTIYNLFSPPVPGRFLLPLFRLTSPPMRARARARAYVRGEGSDAVRVLFFHKKV